MRALCFALMLLAAEHASAYEHFVSPSGKFEAYTTMRWPDGTGMKLFVRRAQTCDTGSLLAENARWIDAKWSPDSRFLAVIDHSDGHIADIYIFGVTAADAAAPPTVTLFYQTPNPGTYDVQWEIVGWHTKRREVVLRQEIRDQNAHTHATHLITAKIGRERLKFDLPKET